MFATFITQKYNLVSSDVILCMFYTCCAMLIEKVFLEKYYMKKYNRVLLGTDVTNAVSCGIENWHNPVQTISFVSKYGV